MIYLLSFSKMNLSIENISKSYGNQKAVSSLSFEVKKGEILGFLGPNGAGKSTTMKIITGYLQSDSGDVKADGVSIFTNPMSYKSSFGYLPENNPLYEDMFVMEFLDWAARIQGLDAAKAEIRRKEVIHLCGFSAEKHKKIGELSKGYKQRVGLAQAIIHDPEILILDEPTTGLDPSQIIEIRELIKELGKEKTIMLSSHILSEVEATCDRIIIINKGQIVADSTPELLKKQLQGKEILQIRIEADSPSEVVRQKLEHLSSIELVQAKAEPNSFRIESVTGETSRKEIFKLCVTNNWFLMEMHGEETSLEDIFIELTSAERRLEPIE